MLKGNNIQFLVEERINVYAKKGKEWALKCKIGDCNIWTLKTYDNKPINKIIENDIALILRSFEFYHKHLEIPEFKIEKDKVVLKFI